MQVAPVIAAIRSNQATKIRAKGKNYEEDAKEAVTKLLPEDHSILHYRHKVNE